MAEKIYDITEIAKRTRESLKKEFPNLTFSVTKESFSGGSSMNVTLMKGDFNPFEKEVEDGYIQLNKYHIDRDDRLTEKAKKVMIRVREIAETYNWDNSDPMTDYFDVNYYLHMGIGKFSKPYEMTASKSGAKKSAPEKSAPSSPKKSYPLGEVLKDCSGWTIYKKTLPDGRIVYNAKIKPETPKNRGDWSAIRGEIYTETAFKWGKFGAFERWGEISNQSETVEKLCQILGKYYEGGDKPAPAPEVPTPDSSLPEVGDRFFVKAEKSGNVYQISKMDMGTIFVMFEGRDFEVPYSFEEVKNNFADGRWVKIQDEEVPEAPTPETEDESLDVIIDGEFAQKVKSEHDAFVLLVNNFGEDELKKMRDNHQVFNDSANKKLYVFRNSFIYGKKNGVPEFFGNDLQLELAERGFEVFVTKGDSLKIYKPAEEDYRNVLKIIDVIPTAKFDLFDSSTTLMGSVNYIYENTPISTPAIADFIEGVYYEKFESDGEEKSQKSVEEIADEVINLEYEIWNKLGIESGGQLASSEDLQEKYADEVRNVIIPVLEKYSLRDSQRLDLSAALADQNAHKLNSSLSLIGYYGKDAKEEAILDYKEYPKWNLNPKYYIKEETPKSKSKEDIEKAIKGLQFLADKGNEKAKKAIIGLKILLNK